MSLPQTLLQMAGADLQPVRLEQASLVLIDLQNEYLEGPLALPDAEKAVAAAARLLAAARDAGTPVFHIAHEGRSGGLFDRAAFRGRFIDSVTPLEHEQVVGKTLPNAFAGTDLHTLLSSAGKRDLVLCGFMTHMCVSSTARAALDLGYRTTIDADACATRDLPDGRGGVIPAAAMHEVSLAALSDRFAVIARGVY